ncbi:uncharacterized protein LOC132270091 [Cornus florida]|uniref:uncharacterized protein LOC132270091 n=1 Tax=Cornus florida TaxID=4283 RepID=UPI00289983B7|nr:uncharacterized protein LOC132270091 [Cornus florida]
MAHQFVEVEAIVAEMEDKMAYEDGEVEPTVAENNEHANSGVDLDDLDLHEREYNFSDIESTYAPSDEFQSLKGSSEDEDEEENNDGGRQNPRVNGFEVGKKYESAEKFRVDLRAHAISEKYDIRFVKNKRERITAKCASDYGWRIHASINTEDGSFEIKTFNSTHHCSYTKINKQASSSFLAKKYIETLRDEPAWKTDAMKKAVLRDLDVIVSGSKVYRAKKKAVSHIEGNHGSQFRRAMSKSFLEGCRPFIGVDGCFLKGPYKGQLLSTLGRDGDNGIFPIAFAVVGSKTKQSWKWFMEQLEKALGLLHRFTFMFDRQKGLVDTFEDMLHGCHHRYCVKHMYENFKKKFKGVKLRNEMWNESRALTESVFKYHVQIIKDIDKGAYEWLANVPPRLWSRHKFEDNSECDLVVNNLAETWNDKIGDARDKPLITMLEWIHGYLMHRNQSKRQWIQNQTGFLCPTIATDLKNLIDDCGHCTTRKAGADIFKDYYKGVNEGVNLANRTCSCREWDVKASVLPDHIDIQNEADARARGAGGNEADTRGRGARGGARGRGAGRVIAITKRQLQKVYCLNYSVDGSTHLLYFRMVYFFDGTTVYVCDGTMVDVCDCTMVDVCNGTMVYIAYAIMLCSIIALVLQ